MINPFLGCSSSRRKGFGSQWNQSEAWDFPEKELGSWFRSWSGWWRENDWGHWAGPGNNPLGLKLAIKLVSGC